MITSSQKWILQIPAEVIFPPLPQTPSESPLIKQRKIESLDTAGILSQFKELSRLINNRSDALERMVGENARAIASMKEAITENTKQITDVKTAVEFVSAEVNDVKIQLGTMKSQMKNVETKSSEQEKRLSHLEGYTRRWNLRVYGIPEKEREDVRENIIQLVWGFKGWEVLLKEEPAWCCVGGVLGENVRQVGSLSVRQEHRPNRCSP
ncbi:hypothetical protein DPX16_18744 [Anabarilius grahami]|uniref:Uncharacterized protein n=1 Tax=Anabarilius grahami TaxID=495550 RepID=A0A3N0Y1N6_ANAGA|nr:hypothetical protein DPX16_18744 [Anabarilius grahami]